MAKEKYREEAGLLILKNEKTCSGESGSRTKKEFKTYEVGDVLSGRTRLGRLSLSGNRSILAKNRGSSMAYRIEDMQTIKF
jgi:hypothetical protein